MSAAFDFRKVSYVCGWCGKRFSSDEDCIRHVKECPTKKALVAILGRRIIDENFVEH